METSTRSCRRQKETAEPGSAVQARGVISHVGATHGAKAPGRMSVWPNGPVVDGWSLANLLTPLCYRRERQPPKVLPMTRLSRLPLMQEHCLSSTAKRQIAPVGCRGTVGIGLQPFAAATAGHSGRAAWTRLFSPEMSCRWHGSTTSLSQRQEPTRWSCHSEAMAVADSGYRFLLLSSPVGAQEEQTRRAGVLQYPPISAGRPVPLVEAPVVFPLSLSVSVGDPAGPEQVWSVFPPATNRPALGSATSSCEIGPRSASLAWRPMAETGNGRNAASVALRVRDNRQRGKFARGQDGKPSSLDEVRLDEDGRRPAGKGVRTRPWKGTVPTCSSTARGGPGMAEWLSMEPESIGSGGLPTWCLGLRLAGALRSVPAPARAAIFMDHIFPSPGVACFFSWPVSMAGPCQSSVLLLLWRSEPPTFAWSGGCRRRQAVKL